MYVHLVAMVVYMYLIQKVRKQGIRFWDERTFWHETIYKSLIPTFGKPL